MPDGKVLVIAAAAAALYLGGQWVGKETNNHVVKPVYHHVLQPIGHIFHHPKK